MAKPPLPAELIEFLAKPNPAVIATVAISGGPATVATWYEWSDDRVLVNMDHSRARLNHIRRDPRVSLTILGRDDWYSHVSLRGRVVSLEIDEDLRDIDRLSRRYFNQAYPVRDRNRLSAWIEVETWYGWATGDTINSSWSER